VIRGLTVGEGKEDEEVTVPEFSRMSDGETERPAQPGRGGISEPNPLRRKVIQRLGDGELWEGGRARRA